MQNIIKNIKSNWKTYQLLLFAVVSFLFVILFSKSAYFEDVKLYAANNLTTIFIISVLLKVIAIIWPPFPATIFIVALMPIVGFWHVFWADYIGEIIGSTLAYWIAYHYGYHGMAHFLDQSTIDKIKKVHIRKENELEFLLILRILGNVFFELICYAAGLLKIDYKKFLLSTVISYFFVAFAVYKLIEGLYSKETFLLNLVLIIVLLLIITKYRHRYIHFEE